MTPLHLLISALVMSNVASAHIYMSKPASRNFIASTLYTPQVFSWSSGTPPLTDPQSLSAGGPATVSGGGAYAWPQGMKGVCGDVATSPQKFMAGGMYWTNITNSYNPGQTVQFQTVLTANHLGYIQFAICKIAESGYPDVTEACLNQYLPLAGQGGEWRTFVSAGINTYTPSFVMPYTPGRYVVRMHYVTGNSCIDPATVSIVGNPTSLPLCGVSGAYPEEFWNCADLTVGVPGGIPVSSATTTTTVATSSVVSSTSVIPTTSSKSSVVSSSKTSAVVSSSTSKPTTTTTRTTSIKPTSSSKVSSSSKVVSSSSKAVSTTKVSSSKASSTKSATATGTTCVFGSYRCNGLILQQCQADATWGTLGTCQTTCYDGSTGYVGCV